MKLKNQMALITGAGKGLGKEIAIQFVKEGASLFLCSRTLSDLEEVSKSLTPYLHEGQKIAIEKIDISNPKEIDFLFEKVVSFHSNFNILVNNAGIYGPFGLLEETDWEEWKKAFEINFYGPVYLCRKIVPYFKKQKYGKIINLSGGGATKPLPRISSYASSKAALVRFVETLALEIEGHHIDVNAIAPGALMTKMTKLLLEAGPKKVGKAFYENMEKVNQEGGTPLEYGAKLAVYLASKESDGITGKLISAVWDPWKNLHTFKKILKKSDVYTLRRIIPEDRNITIESQI